MASVFIPIVVGLCLFFISSLFDVRKKNTIKKTHKIKVSLLAILRWTATFLGMSMILSMGPILIFVAEKTTAHVVFLYFISIVAAVVLMVFLYFPAMCLMYKSFMFAGVGGVEIKNGALAFMDIFSIPLNEIVDVEVFETLEGRSPNKYVVIFFDENKKDIKKYLTIDLFKYRWISKINLGGRVSEKSALVMDLRFICSDVDDFVSDLKFIINNEAVK